MIELIPHPSALIESMRSMGYRPHTALADLIDNSITAKARHISIEMAPSVADSPGYVRVVDDGQGMTIDQLRKALTWGGDGPHAARGPKDLGRFGLGLKTASFSLGRRLTVVTRRDGITSVLGWDLEEIGKTRKWMPSSQINPDDRPLFKGTIFEEAEPKESGTVVLISDTDKLRWSQTVNATDRL